MGYWNPFQNFPVESSYTQTWILIWLVIPILYSKFGIWLCSQPIIDVNIQYDFNDVLTLSFISTCHKLHLLWSIANLKTTYSELNLHLVSSGCDPFHSSVKMISFPLQPLLKQSHCHNSKLTKLRILKMSILDDRLLLVQG